MKLMRLVCSTAILMLLQACASMGKDECVTADWRTIGYEDGARGMPSSQIGQHRKDCAGYGVTPNLKVYLAGRDEGLTQYCRPDNGFQVGAAGGHYAGVCPPSLENAFLPAYRSGHQLYQMRAAVSSVRYRLDSSRQALARVKKKLAEKTILLVSDKTTAKERISLIADISSLTERKNQLEHDIPALEQELNSRAAELDTYQASLSSR